MNSPRLSGRDYKAKRHKPGLDLGRWRDLGLGLALGLVVAAVVYVKDRHLPPAGAGESIPAPRPNAPPPKSVAEAEAPVANYDFYDMLPKFEVVVPEKERDVRRDQPAVKIERPGSYVLQVGSYRTPEDAERVRSQLGKQSVTATVQRVAVDTDV